MIEMALSTVKCADDVNPNELAERLEGYSGADIKTVCRDASFMAARRRIEGLSAAQLRQLKEEEIASLPVTKNDFESAIAKVKSSVNTGDIKKYEEWLKQFGSIHVIIKIIYM